MANRCGTLAIVGRPNVGKSTLLNRLLGQKLAITSHKAQTTRHAILGIKTRAEGQLLFVDTPGLHQRGDGALNRYLNRAARSALAEVDAIVFVVEALKFNAEDQLALTAVAETGVPILAAVNKVDLVEDKSALLPYLETLATHHHFAALIPISARRGEQLDTLETHALALLPEGDNLFPEDQLTDRSARFLAAELLREQLVQRYGDELPYRTSVSIESFQEQDGCYRIGALIWVERDSQKGIIIGQGGGALKATASQARQEMQKLFGCAVHLTVWVKVKQGWSSNATVLASLGYD